MNIINLKVNHIEKPIGFLMEELYFSYSVYNAKGKKQIAGRVEVAMDEAFENIIMDTGKDETIKDTKYNCKLKLIPRTRYYWRVSVWDDSEDSATSETSWFETAKGDEKWIADWITSDFNQNIHPTIAKDIKLDKKVSKARIYICGLGLYEALLNGEKISNEFFTPGNNDYNNWIQYQTYDITKQFIKGNNKLEVILGDGWYKGNFGFNGGVDNIFGDTYALIAEIHIDYVDGTKEIIKTDENWISYESCIKSSSIYAGEVFDATFVPKQTYGVRKLEISKNLLTERLGVPVIVKEEITPIKAIKTPAGETVIDMGQNMVGWVKFKNCLPKDTTVTFQHGEILQDGNFYRENLRYAKAEFTFTSNGVDEWIRPHFTYFGFRYVKINGWNTEIKIENFVGQVVYSDLEQTGEIKTSNVKVNKLISNALWGQKGNFLDIPTDCPQRDERLGWTGDAQVFSTTAAYNMNVYPFFTKYLHDLWLEQKELKGAVPITIPSIPTPSMPRSDIASSGWGDAATIITWNMYLYYGDDTIIKNQFDSMRAWVDYIHERSGDSYLWSRDFHFGDWLALDGENPIDPNGGTETYYIASAYYYHSTKIVAKAAKVIGKDELSEYYTKLAYKIKNAMQNEYFSPNGKLTIDKQAAYVIALYMDIAEEKHKARIAKGLAERIKKDNNHIKTGFIGTPYICKVLSEFGYNDLAYTLLLNEDFPSWLHAVNLGATTIWERWDSVLPDGSMNPQGMNSLNHYAYGSIVEWMYGYMLGIRSDEKAPGFKHAIICPKPSWRMKHAEGKIKTVSGEYEINWSILEDGKLDFNIAIPFNSTATVTLPDANLESICIENAKQIGENVVFEISTGTYNFTYMPTKEYIKVFNRFTDLKALLDVPSIKKIVLENIPGLANIKPYKMVFYEDKSLDELKDIKTLNITEENIANIEKELKSI